MHMPVLVLPRMDMVLLLVGLGKATLRRDTIPQVSLE